jgi:hypothetical protein
LRACTVLPGCAVRRRRLRLFGIVVAAARPTGLFPRHEVYDRVFTSAHDRNSHWYGAFEVPAGVAGGAALIVFATIAAGGRTGYQTARSLDRDREWLLLCYWLLLPLAVFFLALTLAAVALPQSCHLLIMARRWHTGGD